MQLISIIVPTYNAERFLCPTLQTARMQTCRNWELIVVDDGSTDGAPGLLRDFARQDARIRVVTQANAGCATARNTGLRQISADAEYVIFLDHDDLWEPDALETLLRTARARPEAVAVIGGVSEVQDADADALFHSLQSKAMRLQTTSPQVPLAASQSASAATCSDNADTAAFADMAVLNCAITMGQTLIRRDALDRVGELNPACVPSDDWELYLRLELLGSMAKTAQTVIHWRSHDTNTSKNALRMYQAELSVRHSLLARPDLTPEQRHQVRSGFQVARRRIAAQKCGYARENWKQNRVGEALRQCVYALRSYARSFQPLP